jgi:Fe-Mn family superoxide dismutase
MKKDTKISDKNLINDINEEWGSFENFIETFIKESLALFGSGWIYLVRRKTGGLKLIKIFNQDNPWFLGFDPLFCVDLWEHAYYLEYKADRKTYLENFVKVINWDFVESEYNKSINK